MRWICILWLVAASPAWADEVYSPVTPIPGDVIAGYHVDSLYILTPRTGTEAEVNIAVSPMQADGSCVRGPGGGCVQIRKVYQGSEASALINALNTANLSTNSLRKRILTKLAADGVIPSGESIRGTPGVPNLPTPTATTAGE